MTFYLEYRPHKVADLDLARVRELLAQILKKDEIPHAFLFSGPKGLGKTSAARIFARSINCQNRDKNLKKGEFEACQKCDACLELSGQNPIDLIEIDAASNRGIDDIRSLRENIKLLPSSLRYKVYVIDEVHMLTNEAFNALLKTLEEPPHHAVFILCTTNPEKIPGTILSRVMRVNFGKPSKEELARSLERAVKGEGLKIDKDALDEISRRSDASFRDAHKILEQLSFKTKSIRKKDVEELFGSFAAGSLDDFWLLLSREKRKEAILWLWQVLDGGLSPELLLKDILEGLRDMLLSSFGLTKKDEAIFARDEIKKLISLFSRAASQTKQSPIESLPLELAVLDYLPGAEEKQVIPEKEKKPVFLKKEARRLPEEIKTKAKKINCSFKDFEKGWENLLLALKPKNHSASALLRSAKPKSLDGEELLIEVFYQFHKSKLESAKVYELLVETLQEVFGFQGRVCFILGQKKPETVKYSEKKDVSSADDQDLIKTAEELFEGG